MSSNHNKRLAVVTPQHRFPLTNDEQISLRHLRKHLDAFDRFLICPESSHPEFTDFQLIRVPDDELASVWAYNRMPMSARFYEWFLDYEYLLIYQLDCLIFSSDILSWCDRQWDYIGAPWFPNYGSDPSRGFWVVGNGGFSLRKVSSHYAITASHAADAFHYVPEDMFWSWEARRINPEFAIPTPDEAVAFSFECAPRACFEANQRRLPLGCHAWPRYDRAFWEPYLLG